MRRQTMAGLVCSLLVLGAASFATAAPRLTVSIIEATKTAKPKVHPKLVKVQKKLKRVFGGAYNNFQLVGREVLELAQGKPRSVKLPGKRRAEITLLGQKGKRYKMALAVFSKAKRQLKIGLRIPPGQLFFQALPYKKGILVLAFYLRP